MVSSESMSNNQVEWNMAALLNMELSKLRSNSNSYFVQGKYREAIDSLIAMKMTGMHVFTPKERETLKKIENELLNSLLNYNYLGSFNPINAKMAALSVKNIRIKLPEYNEKLMDLLHTHGFLGSYKKDSARMNI